MKKNLVKAAAMLAAATMLAGAGAYAEESDPITMWTWKGTEELMNMETKDIMAVQELSNRTGIATEWINPADSTTEFQMIMTSDLEGNEMFVAPQTFPGGVGGPQDQFRVGQKLNAL